MRRDPSAAETPLIHVDQPTTMNDDVEQIRVDIADRGAAPLRLVGAISPVVLVTIEVALLGQPSDTVPDFPGMIADRESVDVAVAVTATAVVVVGVICVFAGVVDALTVASSRVLIP
jgi:hypothetical protein